MKKIDLEENNSFKEGLLGIYSKFMYKNLGNNTWYKLRDSFKDNKFFMAIKYRIESKR